MRKDMRVDYILDAFSKYEARLVEQSIIHYLRPTLNHLMQDVQIDFGVLLVKVLKMVYFS